MADKLPSGKWRVRARLHGRRITKVFPNRALAEKFEAQVRLNQVDHLIAGNTENVMTFGEYSEGWLRDYCRVEKAESQWSEDERVIKNHLVPAFGGVKLKNLTKGHLAVLKTILSQAKKLGGKVARPYKPKTINNILGLAKVMMSTAVAWERIPSNPFSSVPLLKIGDQDFAFWMPDERDEFIAKCTVADLDFAEAVLIACHTGLREGEIAGLKWEAVDLFRRKVRVHRSYSFKLKKEMHRTKNMKFVDLPMNELVFEMLKRRKIAAANAKSDDFVFPIELLKGACKKLRVRCLRFDVRPIRFHDLRHTFASCLAMAGVPLMVIKELMRHQSYQMTLRYAHLDPKHLQGATDILCGPKQQVKQKLGHERSLGS